jgi:octaprenyl-diphosphate synthase
MAKYGTLEETRLKALDWANTAKAALAPIPESELRSLLEELVDFVVSRIV